MDAQTSEKISSSPLWPFLILSNLEFPKTVLGYVRLFFIFVIQK